MSTMAQTVFIVDDDENIRNMVELMVASIGLSAQTYADAQQFLDDYQDQPGVLVLDIRMPGMSGMVLQERLNERNALLPIIFITGHGDVAMAVEAMQKGAFDFLEKPFRENDLLTKIEGALTLDREQREELEKKSTIAERIKTLSPREYEIMHLVAQGYPNKTIAIDLNIAQGTVEIHRSRVMHKMGARSLAALMRMLMVADELNDI